MKRVAFILLCFLAAAMPNHSNAQPAQPTPAADTPFPTTEMTLANGLKVILVEQHHIPAVAHMLLIGAGSSEDPRGKSGLAHYLEHLLFKGTEKISESDYNKQVAALGGQHNAFTNSDVTAYYVLVSKENLPDIMALESERFLNWNPKEDAYASERDVIVEERRLRTENQPSALLSEAMSAALFRNHPYHTPVIGWFHEMQQLAPEDAKDFFSTYYQPKNATLLLIGDVTPKEAAELAEKYYADWKNTRTVPARQWPTEPPARVSQTLRMVSASVQQPLWRRYYMAPSLISGDTQQAVPLMLLADMLGAEGTGLLYKSLVTTGKATALSVSYSPFSLGPESLSISMTPAPGVTVEALSQAYEAALATILTSKALDEKALTRAKTQLKAEVIFSQDGLEGEAFLIAQIVILGLKPEKIAHLTDEINAVTLEQIRQAATSVLDDRFAVTGYLLPDPKGSTTVTQPVSVKEDHLVH